MTKISIQGSGGAPLEDGNLRIKDGLPIDATLQTVSDVAGNDSILNISTGSVGIGTTTATGILNLFKPSAAVRLMINGDAGQNRLITYRTGGVQRIGLYVNNTAETGSNVGSDFAIRRYTDTGTLGGTPLFIKRSTGNVGINTLTPATTLDVNGTANIAERLTIEADSTATTQSTAVIQNTTANSGIALVPNGTGAITASIPDGTAAGGNARGTNAVDLQISRDTAAKVASGSYSFIGSGGRNVASGPYSSIGGGYNNNNSGDNAAIGGGSFNSLTGAFQCIAGGVNNSITSGFSSSSFIGGGEQNRITAGATQTHCVISGGRNNTVSTAYSTVSGGQSNTASNSHATVVGGQSNVSSGGHSISGGLNCVASGSNSVALGYKSTSSGAGAICIASNDGSGTPTASGNWSNVYGGVQSTATNTYASSIGGYRNIASGVASYALGFRTEAYLRGQLTLGEFFTVGGDAQQSSLTARKLDTLDSAGTTILSLDGTGTTNLIIPNGNNRIWNVKVSTVAVVTVITGTATGVSVGDSFMENRNLLFKRVGGTSSIVGVGVVELIADTSMLTALMTYTAGASQELALTFTAPTFLGGGSLTMRIVSKVELVEVAY